ncbi:hypothetical protein NHX12_019100 [Muraenolepis orangiensis]|uniref:Uncharacterized protein n=1 Tax=Muraenolepis orangiensis TaxID=630683 RepID=A0A9Q0EY74_9TELE|nr:hypothetical protein NHX12_019100 [Muraenolepis orangiensis]
MPGEDTSKYSQRTCCIEPPSTRHVDGQVPPYQLTEERRGSVYANDKDKHDKRLTQALERACDGLGDGLERACDGLGDGLERACDGLGDGLERACDGLGDGLERACDGLGDGLERACDGATREQAFTTDFMSHLSTVTAAVAQAASPWGPCQKASRKSLF